MNELMKVIKARHSDRSAHAPDRRVTDAALGVLLQAARWAPTAHNMQNFEIVIIDDPELLRAIGDIPRTLSADFLRENYRQLSFSAEELRRKKTGVLASTFPMSWQNPYADINRMQPGLLRDSIQGSPVLLLVLYDPEIRAPASDGDFLGIMSLGCVMQNIWLAAQSMGVSLQILSAFGVPQVQGELRPLLRIPNHRNIAFACRVGFPIAPDTPSPRVRRDLTDFAYRNVYGEPVRLTSEA